MLLTEADLESLRRLATAYGVSGAEVVRRLIRDDIKRLDRRERQQAQESS
jgi:hypothetical protein